MLNGNGAAHEETGEATEAPPEGAPATIDYAIVIDFEATCDSSDDELTRLQQCDTHEIIEFPAVWLAARDLPDGTVAGTEIGHFREYVRPVETTDGSPTRTLSDFCTSLTGISQAQLEAASPLAEVLEHFEAWLHERGLVSALVQGQAVLVAHGGWDLGDQLPRECMRKALTVPSYFEAHADLKIVFALTCPDNRGTSLKQMLDYLGIAGQGRQHSGLDDCRNFGRILSALLKLNADVSPTFRTGVGQLRGHGVGKRLGDWDCPCGAVAFGSKAACYRCGEPRPDGLAPPEPAPAAPASTPKEKPRRPGDWDCPSCKAIVFASKLRCFKCTTPRPSHLDAPPSSYQRPGLTRRPGDWDCPNPSCRALVFASKTVCFRCGSAPQPLLYGLSMGQPAMLLHPQGGVAMVSGNYNGAGAMMMQQVAAMPAGYVYAQSLAAAQNGQTAQQMQQMASAQATGGHTSAQQQQISAAQYAAALQQYAALAAAQHAQHASGAEAYGGYASQYYGDAGYNVEYDVSSYDQSQLAQMGTYGAPNGASMAYSGAVAVNGQPPPPAANSQQ